MKSAKISRLGYLDWMRGLAAVIMLQGHVFEAWVRPQDRGGEWFWLTQFLGGLPAPIFLFLVGVSLSLLIDKMQTKGLPRQDVTRMVVGRAAWILLLAYVFRLHQFLEWYPYSRAADLFKVDTLNCIGASMLLLGLVPLGFKSRGSNALMMALAGAAVTLTVPFLYPVRLDIGFVAQSYLNGAGHPEYFSLIPWITFAIAGMSAGWLMLDARARQAEARFFSAVAVCGVFAYATGTAMSLSRVFEYGFFDYSLTSPHFFLVRLGWVLLIFYGAYRWSERANAGRWSPLKTLGQASLLVYWVHIELVYGPLLNSLLGRSLTFEAAAVQLLWVIPGMTLLAYKRDGLKATLGDWLRRNRIRDLANNDRIAHRKAKHKILPDHPPGVAAYQIDKLGEMSIGGEEK